MNAAMSCALLITVHFHDGRYHGAGDWPPSPARLFQALVAGAAHGGAIAEVDRVALKWLEALAPPVIAAPRHRAGQGFAAFVPNNDLDAVGGDLSRVSKIRAAKAIKPRLFDVGIPFLYSWRFEEGAEKAEAICTIAERLYQLGRGVDMAFANGELLDEADAESRLAGYDGAIYRPVMSGAGEPLACPAKNSLESLEQRFVRMRGRLSIEGKLAKQLFTQPPKPRFVQIPYDSPLVRLFFDLRTTDKRADFVAWPMTSAASLVRHLRDAAERKLSDAIPNKAATIERVFIGRNATDTDKDQRLRILPLPSIGHPHAERSIRRVLVEIPPNCGLPQGDIDWAFSGLELHDAATGEFAGWSLVPTTDHRMLDHYGISSERRDVYRGWRTVTPAVLPERAARRRIDPKRMVDEAKGAMERAAEEGQAATAVLDALRHARLTTRVVSIQVQREPFEARGGRAEAFAMGTRFAKERLWHVEIAFAEPAQGPIVIGDGRYLGLGLMAPVKNTWRDIFVFPLLPETRVAMTDRAALLHAVRRALMALSRNNEDAVPRLFSGHEPDGAPAGSGGHEHVFLAVDDADSDGRVDRVIVAAPWVCDRSGQSPRQGDRALFDHVVSSLREVRAGKLGVINFGTPVTSGAEDSVFGSAQTWESRTPYCPTRYASRGKDPAAAVMQDVVTECERRGLPRPKVEAVELDAGPNGGHITARVRLCFAVAVEGPIMLGRDSHMGGGLFATAPR